MEPGDRKRSRSKRLQYPSLTGKEVPHDKPSTSHQHRASVHHNHHPTTRVEIDEDPEIPLKKRFFKYLYNDEKQTFCGRTCLSWLYIVIYAIVYMLFLATYTMIFLFGALWIIRLTTDYRGPKIDFLTYSEHEIGLSMTPITESYEPFISYRMHYSEDYDKYVNALDELLHKKGRKRHTYLGPCGETPYGYAANTPCIIARINKHFHRMAKPLELNSDEARIAPVEVQNWMKKDKKLWLHCEGYHPYDKEHIGMIRYFPDPPGFEPSEFPLEAGSESALVAIQISNFTLGLSLSLECKLWYANGPTSVNFLLYVPSNDKEVSNRANV